MKIEKKYSSDGFVPFTDSYEYNIKQLSYNSDIIKSRKFIIISVIFFLIFIILIKYIRLNFFK